MSTLDAVLKNETMTAATADPFRTDSTYLPMGQRTRPNAEYSLHPV